MKRAGGGFDYSFNAQTAIDEAAHTIAAAEVLNTSPDVQQLFIVPDLRSLKSLCRSSVSFSDTALDFGTSSMRSSER